MSRKRRRFRQRARLALPVLKSSGILEIAEEMARGIETLPSQHFELRNDDRVHLLRVADERRDEAARARQPAAARAHEHRPRAFYAAEEHLDFLGERCAAGLIAKRDVPALDALPVLLKIGLDHNRARAPPHGAPRLDGGDAFDLDRRGLHGPFEDFGLLDAVADGGLNRSATSAPRAICHRN